MKSYKKSGYLVSNNLEFYENSELLEDIFLGQNLALIFEIPLEDHQEFYASERSEFEWINYLIEQGWIKLN